MYRSFSAIAVVLIAVVCLSSCGGSKKTVKRMSPGLWQPQPIVEDGYNNDWPSPYPEYDDKAMLGYVVSNDKDNIYISVETGDPATQLKILKQGLTVWIDRKGNKDEITAINYPIPMTEEHKANTAAHDPSRPSSMHMQGQSGGGAGSSQDRQRMELEDRVRRMLPRANQYSLQGFKSCNLQYPILENDSCGVVVRMALDSDNELVWEATIPFKAFYFKNEITRADRGKAISICFETTGEKRPAGQNNNGNRGSGGGGGMRPSMGLGMGGGMGMGMRMGGGGGGRGGNRNAQNPADNIMEPLYKSTKTYKKFGLAFQ